MESKDSPLLNGSLADNPLTIQEEEPKTLLFNGLIKRPNLHPPSSPLKKNLMLLPLPTKFSPSYTEKKDLKPSKLSSMSPKSSKMLPSPTPSPPDSDLELSSSEVSNPPNSPMKEK